MPSTCNTGDDLEYIPCAKADGKSNAAAAAVRARVWNISISQLIIVVDDQSERVTENVLLTA